MSKKLKDLLSENITTMGGVVSRPAFTNLDMGFRTQKSTKLTNIVEDMYGDSKPKINVKEFVQEIGQYGSYGKEIYREGNLKELASRLSKLAETAKQHTLQETEDWFDKITVNRNMKELTGLSNQFKKVASEAQSLQERMSTLYEDMGHILSRYYEINGDSAQNEIVEEEFNGIVREGEYEEFFQKAMKKFGISSPDELDDDKKKEFFNYVDDNFSAKNEMTFKGLRILPSGAIGDVVYFKDKEEMMKAFKNKKARPLHSEKNEGEAENRKAQALRKQLEKLRLKIAQIENEPNPFGGGPLQGLKRKRDMMKQQIRKLTGKEGVTEQSYSFAGKKYKKKSSAPVSDPRVNRDSQGTAVNPIDKQLDALRQQSRELTAKAEKAGTFKEKQPLLAKRKAIQMKIKQLVRRQG